MIIHDLDFLRAIRSLRPPKADSPLLVYSDAVLTFPVAGQQFKMVAVKLGQIVQGCRRFQHPQPFLGLKTEALKSWNPFALGEAFGFSILKVADQISA